MSFSFGFFDAESASSLQGCSVNDINDSETKPAYEHCLSSVDAFKVKSEPFGVIRAGELEIKKSLLHLESGLDEHEDIVKGVYEGGHKVWECSLDLVQYMTEEKERLPSVGDSSVIELGCGHAIPAIAALLVGYRDVSFCDFNEEVILNTTIPNILLNIELSESVSIHCYSGDWISLSENIFEPRGRKFDLILSAETLYHELVSAKLASMVRRLLSNRGVALISSKRFYFGVGGGTEHFIESIRQQNISHDTEMNRSTNSDNESTPVQLIARVVKVYEDGSSNIREIIQVTAQR